MILISPDLHEVNLVAFRDLHASLFQRSLHRFCKDLPPILRRTYDVVKEKRFVVPFEDVFAHPFILSHVIDRGDIYGKDIRAAELRGMF